MVFRVFGLKEEKSYGEDVSWDKYSPDWHQNVSSADFKLNDDPVTYGGGSRMVKKSRAGIMKPTGTVEGVVDLQRIGHYFKAFLDEYKFTKGSGNKNNIHEFWGNEGAYLHSFNGIQAYDIFMKRLTGLLCDGLKLECSDEFMTFSSDWIYKNESSEKISADECDKLEMEGDIPIMFYDIILKLNNKDPKGVQTSFSMEGKNNLNVDKTYGFGARYAQKTAWAQKREINLSLVTTLDEETLDTILAGEYGEIGAMEPAKCRVMKVPLELIVQICEDESQKMSILFPECVLNVEYSLSESDEIEATINLSTMGASTVKLEDGTEVTTDIYIKLENSQDEIGAEKATNGTSNKTSSNVSNATLSTNAKSTAKA